VDRSRQDLSLARQCELLDISRSSLYYQSVGENELNLKLMRLIDEQHLQTPFYGTRQMMRCLRRKGFVVSRKRVRRLMQLMGIHAIYQKPRTTIANKTHEIYPYLLRNLVIDQPNQVWCTDITYLPMEKGFMYLIAIMDWYSRKVLSWRVSNSMEVEFCLEALQDALELYGQPGIFNTDQGSQFTSLEFTGVLKNAGIRISMDGKGRWMDNVFIERLWRSLKYECVYIQAFGSGSALRMGLNQWFIYYNTDRPHSTFSGQTPDEVYNNIAPFWMQLAA
jgi:putative transposase